MPWYAVSSIMWVRFKDQRQDSYPIWENVHLVEAADFDEARVLGEQRARVDEGDSDGSFRWDDRSAEWVFAGVRKVTSCDDATERPRHGTELTYSEFDVDTFDAVERLAAGLPVQVTYVE